LVLCSCLSEEKTELVSSLSSSSSSEFEPCPIDAFDDDPVLLRCPPCHFEFKNQLIQECPPEDIALCPIRIRRKYMDYRAYGNKHPCRVKTSKEELLFGAQGGVRCITASNNEILVLNNHCVINKHWTGFTSQKCSWFTITQVSEYVVHISIDKNETGMERKDYLSVGSHSCMGQVLITQLPSIRLWLREKPMVSPTYFENLEYLY
jgi:hypothetical protein